MIRKQEFHLYQDAKLYTDAFFQNLIIYMHISIHKFKFLYTRAHIYMFKIYNWEIFFTVEAINLILNRCNWKKYRFRCWQGNGNDMTINMLNTLHISVYKNLFSECLDKVWIFKQRNMRYYIIEKYTPNKICIFCMVQ